MRFPSLIFIYAASLFLGGVFFQVLTSERDATLLVPFFFAGIIFLMGLVTLRKEFYAFGKHGAAGLSLIAFITNVGSFLDISFSDPVNYSSLAKALTAFFSIIFLAIAVRKMGQERQNKETSNGTE